MVVYLNCIKLCITWVKTSNYDTKVDAMHASVLEFHRTETCIYRVITYKVIEKNTVMQFSLVSTSLLIFIILLKWN